LGTRKNVAGPLFPSVRHCVAPGFCNVRVYSYTGVSTKDTFFVKIVLQ
jgi:hypothetical protein